MRQPVFFNQWCRCENDFRVGRMIPHQIHNRYQVVFELLLGCYSVGQSSSRQWLRIPNPIVPPDQVVRARRRRVAVKVWVVHPNWNIECRPERVRSISNVVVNVELRAGIKPRVGLNRDRVAKIKRGHLTIFKWVSYRFGNVAFCVAIAVGTFCTDERVTTLYDLDRHSLNNSQVKSNWIRKR